MVLPMGLLFSSSLSTRPNITSGNPQHEGPFIRGAEYGVNNEPIKGWEYFINAEPIKR